MTKILSEHKRLLLFSFLFLFLFTTTAILVNTQTAGFIDNSVNKTVEANRVHPVWISKFFSEVFHPGNLLVVATIVSFFLYFKGKKYSSFLLFFSLLFSIALALLLKELFQIDRPVGIIEEEGWSFPSVHASSASALFFSLIYLSKERVHDKNFLLIFWSLLFILTVAVGYSRLYLGVHWLSDIVAAIALGIFTASTIAMVLHLFEIKDNGKNS